MNIVRTKQSVNAKKKLFKIVYYLCDSEKKIPSENIAKDKIQNVKFPNL